MDSLHLKWSNHYQHVSTTFRHIFDDEAFTDVTIVCRDGSVRAHKLVLASCSAFFRRVFAENPSAQMVFMVRGACVADVRTLMEFAYKGDVRISRDEVNRLGELAEDLEFGEFWKVVENAVSENVVATEIKEEELMIEVEEMDAEEEKEKFVFLENLEIRAADETQTLTIKTESPGNDEIQQASMVSPSHSTRSGNSTSCSSKTQKKSEADEETTKDDSELEEKAEAAKRRNLILTCKICKQKFKNTKLLSLHIKNHVKTNKKPFACDDCSASFKRSSHLSRHKLIHTGERPFRCCMCDKAFSRLDKLKQHARNTHDTIVTNELLQENAGSSCKYIGTDVNDSGRRKSRGRPRKSNLSSTPQQENETSNPDETFNLPFGDLNWYLTMPETETEAETETDPRLKIMEPVVEIKTETAKSKVAFGKIGQCTVSVGNYT